MFQYFIHLFSGIKERVWGGVGEAQNIPYSVHWGKEAHSLWDSPLEFLFLFILHVKCAQLDGGHFVTLVSGSYKSISKSSGYLAFRSNFRIKLKCWGTDMFCRRDDYLPALPTQTATSPLLYWDSPTASDKLSPVLSILPPPPPSFHYSSTLCLRCLLSVYFTSLLITLTPT